MNTLSWLKLLILLGSIMLSATGCGRFNPCQEEEIYRITSQDGVVDGVILTKDCGATTSLIYRVYIVPKGHSINGKEPIFLANRVKGLEISWIRPKLIRITYNKAKIFKFTNFWDSREVDNFMYEVVIQEREISEHVGSQN